MKKKCEKCGRVFICSHSIKCWCTKLKVSEPIGKELKKKYSDCLCKSCLEQYVQKEKNNLSGL